MYDNRQGTFLLLKIGGDYFLQKLYTKYFDHPYREKLVIANRLKLNNHIDFDYTVDSILLANTQWIYPFVYKDESLKVYNIQQPADHEPYYGMHFKIHKKEGHNIYFTETSITKSKTFLPGENLNYSCNSSTYIYRLFIKLTGLINGNMKAFDSQ